MGHTSAMKERHSRISSSAVCIAMAMACFIAATATEAEESPKAFTLTTTNEIGVLFGQANEYIYNQYLSTDYKNSELTWPFKPLIYAGAGLNLYMKMGIFAGLDLRQAYSGKTGTQTDSDFMNGDGVRTHYSESDCYTERATFLDLRSAMICL